MGRKTPPHPEYPEWTEARFWTFIRSAVRKAHVKWPPPNNLKRKIRRDVVGAEA